MTRPQLIMRMKDENIQRIQQLAVLTGKMIAKQTYPHVIREREALEITAHLLWDMIRGEEPVAEVFGSAYATGYLEQVSKLDAQ